MKGSTKLFRIFGIEIKLHFSWWFVFFLLAWSLSSSLFPNISPGLSKMTYWFMGVVASLMLFVSVLLHELSHSLVAKTKNIQVKSITLFFFGGVAGISDEDMKPSSEFLMAISGPLFSLLLSGIFYLIYFLNSNFIFSGILNYLYQINLILAIFNLVPAYPLDGGRALRSILYWYYKDLKKATGIAATGGKFFALFLIFTGVFTLISGIGGGLWFILLGGFLYFIAKVSNEQIILKEALSKILIKDLILKKFTILNPEMKFVDFLKKYKNSEQEFFLVKNGNVFSLLNLNLVNRISPKMQQLLRIKQISIPFKKVGILKFKDNAYVAFRKFSEQNLDVISVNKNGKFFGVITRKILMRRLVWSLKFGKVINNLSKDQKIKRKRNVRRIINNAKLSKKTKKTLLKGI